MYVETSFLVTPFGARFVHFSICEAGLQEEWNKGAAAENDFKEKYSAVQILSLCCLYEFYEILITYDGHWTLRTQFHGCFFHVSSEILQEYARDPAGIAGIF